MYIAMMTMTKVFLLFQTTPVTILPPSSSLFSGGKGESKGEFPAK
jgi:hypothetical protein